MYLTVSKGGKRFAVALFLGFALIAFRLISNWSSQYRSFEDLLGRRTTQHSNLDEMLQKALQKAGQEKKVILLWHGNTTSERLQFVVNNMDLLYPSDSCGLCEVTTDKSRIHDRNTAAVVIEYDQVKPGSMPPPEHRRLDQLYIWCNKESPVNMMYNKKDDLEFADAVQFNATMTNRRDSDIYTPYHRVVDLLPRLEKNLTKILNLKTKLAIAFISNCDRMPGSTVRLDYLKRMKASGFQFDALGKCFGAEVGKKSRGFYTGFVKKYKFYFAFENSYHCRDYITEKVFRNAIQADSVPVVWGATREDYRAAFPPHSYIHLEDFASLKDLTDYLNYLDKNDTAYLEYFRWRTKPKEEFREYRRKVRFCQLCRILHGINIDDMYDTTHNPESPIRPLFADVMTPRTVPSLIEWFYKSDNDECMHEIKDLMP